MKDEDVSSEEDSVAVRRPGFGPEQRERMQDSHTPLSFKFK